MDMDIFRRMLSSVMRDMESIYTEDEAFSVFRYYFTAYKRTFGIDHPHIRKQQIERIVELMPYWKEQNPNYSDGQDVLEPEEYQVLIDCHFQTDYAGKINYNINHFFSGRIRELLYYKFLYE